MDQIMDLVSYQELLEQHNLSAMINRHRQQHSSQLNGLMNNSLASPTFNFTEAADIFNEFMLQGAVNGADYTTIILLILYVPVFLLALLGNLLVLATLVRQRRSIGKAKNLYLLNLALADLFVTLLCMPAVVGELVHHLWLYGVFLCKFNAFLQGVAVASSIFTLTAMSIDRYITIQHPVATLTGMTTRQAVVIMLLTWIVAAIFMGPLLYVRQVDTIEFPEVLPDLPAMTFCIENWPQDHDRRAFGLFTLVVIFVLPTLTLAVCYAHVGRTLCHSDHYRQSSDSSGINRMNSRKRAARMLIALVVVFVACWLPYNITSLCIDLSDHLHRFHHSFPSFGGGAASPAAIASDAESSSSFSSASASLTSASVPTSSSPALSAQSMSTSSLSSSSSALLGTVNVLPYTLWLGHAHSAINPLMYWVMNRRFRHSVSCMLRSIKRSGLSQALCGVSSTTGRRRAIRRSDNPRFV